VEQATTEDEKGKLQQTPGFETVMILLTVALGSLIVMARRKLKN
jgi:hypothetical protein